MRKLEFAFGLVLFVFLLNLTSARLAQASDKEMYFLLQYQRIDLYENGDLIGSYPIISGYDGVTTDEETGRRMYKPTPKGKFRVLWKAASYKNGAGVQMPYSLFFTHAMHAVHAWSLYEPLPDPGTHRYASHGCISVDRMLAEWLFDWADEDTIIYIWGERVNKKKL